MAPSPDRSAPPHAGAGRGVALVAAAARRLAPRLERLAMRRPPAVDDPAPLSPGTPPPTGGRVLVLYDGTCGICLYGRDLLAALDRRQRLAHDRLQRHAGGLLADLHGDALDGTWHVVLPDGRRLERGDAVVAVLSALPGGAVIGGAARLGAPLVDRGYRWFAANRTAISQRAGLTQHPDRDGESQRPAPRS